MVDAVPAGAAPDLELLAVGDLSRWTVAWGWESTIDYRYQIEPGSVGSGPGPRSSGDSEVSVTPQEFLDLKKQLDASQGVAAQRRPGGSPLLSALAIEELRRWNPRLSIPSSRFWGIYPPILRSLIPPSPPGLLADYGMALPSIQGTLCVEDRSRSVKQMYSVGQSRRLTDQVSEQLQATLARLAEACLGQGVVLGVGGLNKARPPLLRALIDRFERQHLAGPRVKYISTNSFAEILASPRGNQLMAQYLGLLRTADVVSMSAEEVDQLAGGLEFEHPQKGLYPLMAALELPGLAVCHHRRGVAIRLGQRFATPENRALIRAVGALAVQEMSQYFAEGRTVLAGPDCTSDSAHSQPTDEYEQAFGIAPDHPDALPAPAVTRSGARELTGSGSRFDGYLSALLPLVWDRLRLTPG